MTISYTQLHSDGDFLVVSTSGVRPNIPWLDKYARVGKRVICAYDADKAGDEAAMMLAEHYPHIERERPQHGKDWNDQLPRPEYIGEERPEETFEEQSERFRLEWESIQGEARLKDEEQETSKMGY